jgi:hypothetical protein
MVKIQSRLIRKQYKRSSKPYVYKQLLLPFPARCNRVLEPFLKKKLHFAMDVKDGSISISLAEKKDRIHENS